MNVFIYIYLYNYTYIYIYIQSSFICKVFVWIYMFFSVLSSLLLDVDLSNSLLDETSTHAGSVRRKEMTCANTYCS